MFREQLPIHEVAKKAGLLNKVMRAIEQESKTHAHGRPTSLGNR